jgi:chorismate-pyruvate lyase
MSSSANQPIHPAATALPIAYPLDDFYAQQGLVLPKIEAVDGADVPEPYRRLLVHQDDMTPTLEKFHGDTIHLKVLSRQQRDGFYFREVVLLLDQSDRPVEFGAIKLNLSLFAPAARKMILEEREPVGHILRDHLVVHSSRPKAYLRVQSDELINRVLGLTGVHTLYGRRNTHFDPQGRAMAEIVEILPPEPASK